MEIWHFLKCSSPIENKKRLWELKHFWNKIWPLYRSWAVLKKVKMEGGWNQTVNELCDITGNLYSMSAVRTMVVRIVSELMRHLDQHFKRLMRLSQARSGFLLTAADLQSSSGCFDGSICISIVLFSCTRGFKVLFWLGSNSKASPCPISLKSWYEAARHYTGFWI